MFCRQRYCNIHFAFKNFRQIKCAFHALNDKSVAAGISISDHKHLVKTKFNELVVWYEELTGMDEVRMMQKRVIDAQDKFIAAQEKRRNLSKELNKIQTKLKEIYSELDTTSRGEERYLQLITQEHAILKEERKLTAEFSLVEREERDSFTNLSSSVKESHERERAQAERTKYWSIIGSVIGTIIGIAGSSINNEFKMRQLKKLVEDMAHRDSMKSSDLTAASILAHHEQKLSSIVNEMKSTLNMPEGGNVLGKINKMLHNVSHGIGSTSLDSRSVKHLEEKVDQLADKISDMRRYNGQLVMIPNDLEKLIEKQAQERKHFLIGVAVVGIAIPFLISALLR